MGGESMTAEREERKMTAMHGIRAKVEDQNGRLQAAVLPLRDNPGREVSVKAADLEAIETASYVQRPYTFPQGLRG
jgi:hypothetical protein